MSVSGEQEPSPPLDTEVEEEPGPSEPAPPADSGEQSAEAVTQELKTQDSSKSQLFNIYNYFTYLY